MKGIILATNDTQKYAAGGQAKGCISKMSQAEKQALALRDIALRVVMAKGVVAASDLYSYHDARIRIEYCSGKPKTLDVFKRGDIGRPDAKVLSVILNDDGDGEGSVVVLHRGRSWEESLRRVAKTCA